MTFAALLPFLLSAAGGFAVRHFNILGKLASMLGNGNIRKDPPMPTLSPAPLNVETILKDAVLAAIRQAAADAFSGHLQSIKQEIVVAVQVAIKAAASDLKAKE